MFSSLVIFSFTTFERFCIITKRRWSQFYFYRRIIWIDFSLVLTEYCISYFCLICILNNFVKSIGYLRLSWSCSLIIATYIWWSFSLSKYMMMIWKSFPQQIFVIFTQHCHTLLTIFIVYIIYNHSCLTLPLAVSTNQLKTKWRQQGQGQTLESTWEVELDK